MRFQRIKQHCAQVAAALLAVAAALSTTACGQATAAAEQPLTRAQIGAQQACPPGHVVEWISAKEHECLKESK